MSMSMSNARMPDRPASSQSGTGQKETNDAGTSPLPDEAHTVRHFSSLVLDKYSGSGMLMPALVSPMPMPSYAYDNLNLLAKSE